MKKFLLLSLLSASLPIFAQTEVNSFFSGTNEGLTYTLPDTRIEVTIKAACITHTPGEFNRYAERYLRISNAIAEVSTYWEMTDITVKTLGKANPEKMYTIRLNNSAINNINLGKDGIIKSINIKEKEECAHVAKQAVLHPQKQSNRADVARYMTEEMIQATSTAKLAELTAKEIYATRESKLDITRGLADIMPQDGLSMQLVLNELNKQEAALTELFTGRSDTIYSSVTYTIEPTVGCDTTKAVIFRFSHKLGFVDKEDLAGEPVYYSLRDLRSVHIPTPEELENKRILKKEGVCYNIPGKVDFSIYTRSKKLYESEIAIAQLGVTEILSKDLFKKKSTAKVLFDPATGGIISIEK